MTIKDRLEEWQTSVDFCEARIRKLVASIELFTHSMMVIPYIHTGKLPPIFRPNELTPWGHYRDDIERAIDNLIELEAEGLVHIDKVVKAAFKTLLQLGQEEKLDEKAMDTAYRAIVEGWFFLEGTGKIAEACVPKGDNPYPKARPLAPLTKKELEDKIADMKLRIDLEKDANRRLLYRSALRSYEERLREVSD